jgi:hypothetical protein
LAYKFSQQLVMGLLGGTEKGSCAATRVIVAVMILYQN